MKFYPSENDFTLALLLMLVTKITSEMTMGVLLDTPANVSIQDVVDLLHGGLGVLLQEGVQLHHHARAGGEEGKHRENI